MATATCCRLLLIEGETERLLLLIVFGIFDGLLALVYIAIFLSHTLLYTGFALIIDWPIRKKKASITALSDD